MANNSSEGGVEGKKDEDNVYNDPFKVIRLLDLLLRQRAEVRRQELSEAGRLGGVEREENGRETDLRKGRRRSEREEGRSSNTSSESCSTRERGRALGTTGGRGNRTRSQERQVSPLYLIRQVSPETTILKFRFTNNKCEREHQLEILKSLMLI